jgi:hypothetical protein
MSESDRILRALNQFTAREVGKTQLRIMQVLTTETPVDTNFARSRWTPSVGSAPKLDGSAAPSGTNRAAIVAEAIAKVSANEALSQGIAKTYKLRMGPLYISNNTAYIGVLNGGSSAQAPARFVEAGVLKGIRGR